MNDTVSLNQVRDCVRQWFSRTLTIHGSWIKVQIVDDQPEYFRAIMYTIYCIAELIIFNNNDFAPNRWISLQVLRVKDTSNNEPVFYYGDTHQDTMDVILAQLDQGFQLLLQGN